MEMGVKDRSGKRPKMNGLRKESNLRGKQLRVTGLRGGMLKETSTPRIVENMYKDRR